MHILQVIILAQLPNLHNGAVQRIGLNTSLQYLHNHEKQYLEIFIQTETIFRNGIAEKLPQASGDQQCGIRKNIIRGVIPK